MPASQEQKVDFLLKKIGYSASKTGIAEDESTISSGSNTAKKPFEEGIPSPLIIPSTSLWSDSSLIPTTPPGSDTAYVKVYSTTSALRMTRDATVGTNTRSYIAYTTYNNTSSARLTNWIDTQFGASYIIKVYKDDPTVPANELQQAGANAGTDGWFFDYSSGILNFNGVNLPSGISATNIYLVGYRYIGGTGAKPPAGIGTFKDLVVERHLSVGGISTFTGSIDANSNLDVAGISTFQGLIDANGLIEATAGQNKIPSLYANYSDLPNAGTYHGMFAHVHATQKGYFAHAGGWYELVNKETTGIVGTGTERYNIGSLNVTGITTLGSIGISTGRITGPAITYIDPATVGDDTGLLVVKGNLQVEGTQTVVNSSTMTVTDKNIELAKGAANDAAADGGGITVDSGDGDKTWQWLDATDSWTSSEHIRIPDDKVFGFAGDTNTYIGRPAADTIAFTHGGSEKVRIDSSGRLLIGTTTEGFISGDNLTVADSGDCGITIRSGTSSTGSLYFSRATSGSAQYSGALRYAHPAGALQFYTNGAEKVRIDSSGRVLIGTTTEGRVTADNLTIASNGHTGMTIRSGTSSGGNISFSDGTSGDDENRGLVSYDHASNFMRFFTNATEKLRIDTDGNTNIVGIITASNFDYFDRGDYLSNIKLGHDAGNANLVSNGAQFNILIGYKTGNALTSGDNAVMIGANAGRAVTTGSGGVHVGFNCGRYNQSGNSNVYIGAESGSGTAHSGNNNTFVGTYVGIDRIGSDNTLVGYYAGRGIGGQTNNGDKLSFFGNQAGQRNVSGDQNSAFGYFTLHNNQSGDKNSGFGNEVLKNSTGNYNSAFGADAGKNLTSGANNLILGYNAQASTNSTSNEITLGDANITKFRIPGIGVTFSDDIVILPAPIDASGDLTVGGNFKVVGVSTFSDDVTFTSANNNNLLFDKSDNSLKYGDSVRAKFGASTDMEIYHTTSGNTNFIKGTGNLFLQSNVIVLEDQSGNDYIRIDNGGAVKINHPGSTEKLRTTSTGVQVTGLTDTDTLTTGNATFTGTISAGSTTGTNGYYLKTTGIGVTWAAFPSSRTGLTTSATAGQTTFNFSYNIGFVDVFLNGVKLPSSEFTASNGSTIVLDDAAFANDTLEFISLNTLPVTSAENLSNLQDVNITSPKYGQTLRYNGVKFVNDFHPHATTTSTSQVSITNLPIASYRSAEYLIQVTEGTKYHVTKIIAIHDGTNVTFNEYGTITTHSSLATFTLDINSGIMRLLATPASTNSTTFKVKFDAITV